MYIHNHQRYNSDTHLLERFYTPFSAAGVCHRLIAEDHPVCQVYMDMALEGLTHGARSFKQYVSTLCRRVNPIL